MVVHFRQTQRFTGDVGLVAHHGDRQRARQARHKLRPDLRRLGGGGGGAVNHKQHSVGLFDLVPRTFDADTLNLVAGVAQAGGVDDVQRHAVDMDMFAQDVAGGAGDIGDDRRLTPG